MMNPQFLMCVLVFATATWACAQGEVASDPSSELDVASAISTQPHSDTEALGDAGIDVGESEARAEESAEVPWPYALPEEQLTPTCKAECDEDGGCYCGPSGPCTGVFPENVVCFESTCHPQGCSEDAECAALFTGGNPVCVARNGVYGCTKDGCNTDADCDVSVGYTCSGVDQFDPSKTYCKAPGCSQDSDCYYSGHGKRCDVETGDCFCDADSDCPLGTLCRPGG